MYTQLAVNDGPAGTSAEATAASTAASEVTAAVPGLVPHPAAETHPSSESAKRESACGEAIE